MTGGRVGRQRDIKREREIRRERVRQRRDEEKQRRKDLGEILREGLFEELTGKEFICELLNHV